MSSTRQSILDVSSNVNGDHLDWLLITKCIEISLWSWTNYRKKRVSYYLEKVNVYGRNAKGIHRITNHLFGVTCPPSLPNRQAPEKVKSIRNELHNCANPLIHLSDVCTVVSEPMWHLSLRHKRKVEPLSRNHLINLCTWSNVDTAVEATSRWAPSSHNDNHQYLHGAEPCSQGVQVC